MSKQEERLMQDLVFLIVATLIAVVAQNPQAVLGFAGLLP